MRNLLKEKLYSKLNVISSFMKLASPTVTEIAKLAGFSYIIIDCEHGSLSILDAENMACSTFSEYVCSYKNE